MSLGEEINLRTYYFLFLGSSWLGQIHARGWSSQEAETYLSLAVASLLKFFLQQLLFPPTVWSVPASSWRRGSASAPRWVLPAGPDRCTCLIISVSAWLQVSLTHVRGDNLQGSDPLPGSDKKECPPVWDWSRNAGVPEQLYFCLFPFFFLGQTSCADQKK